MIASLCEKKSVSKEKEELLGPKPWLNGISPVRVDVLLCEWHSLLGEVVSFKIGKTDNTRIIYYPELEGTYKNQKVQLLAPHTTTQKSDHVCENIVLNSMLPELQ